MAGTFYDLNTQFPSGTGWILTDAIAINDNGQILGTDTLNGINHVFRLDPVPTMRPMIAPHISGALVQVADVKASDSLSGVAPGSSHVTGTSYKPSDPKDPDIVITPDGSGGYLVQLRAERLATGTGHAYTLNATATDLAGNMATVTATCTVPHDLGHHQ